jgi:hypothetical protein
VKDKLDPAGDARRRSEDGLVLRRQRVMLGDEDEDARRLRAAG